MNLNEAEGQIRISHGLSTNFFNKFRQFQPIVQILSNVDVKSNCMCLRIVCCDATTSFDRIGFRKALFNRIKRDGLDNPETHPKIRILDYKIVKDTATEKFEDMIVIAQYFILQDDGPTNHEIIPYAGDFNSFFKNLRILVQRHSKPAEQGSYFVVITKINNTNVKTTSDGKQLKYKDINLYCRTNTTQTRMRLVEDEIEKFDGQEGDVIQLLHYGYQPIKYFEMIYLFNNGSSYILNPVYKNTVDIAKCYYFTYPKPAYLELEE